MAAPWTPRTAPRRAETRPAGPTYPRKIGTGASHTTRLAGDRRGPPNCLISRPESFLSAAVGAGVLALRRSGRAEGEETRVGGARLRASPEPLQGQTLREPRRCERGIEARRLVERRQRGRKTAGVRLDHAERMRHVRAVGSQTR